MAQSRRNELQGKQTRSGRTLSADRAEAPPGASNIDFIATFNAQAKSQEATNQLLQQLIAAMAQQAQQSAQSQTQILQALTTPAINPAGQSTTPSPGTRTQPNLKTPEPNKPPLLDAQVTLEGFDTWRSTWEDYAACFQFDVLPVPQQLARFRTFLSTDMRAELMHGIGIGDTDNLPVKDVLERIRAHIRKKRNIALDRVAFEEVKQTEGESFDSFYINLRKKAANADLCVTCFDSRLTTRIMVGIRDAETRRKLLAITPFPSLQAVVDLCRSEECGRRNEELLGSPTAEVNQAYKGKRGYRSRSAGPSRGPQHGGVQSGQKTCGRCGKTHPRFSCPAFRHKCTYCQKEGHFAKCCRKAKADGKSTEQKEDRQSKDRAVTSVSLQIAAASADTVKKAPQVAMDVYDKASRWLGSVDVTPDSAAEATVASCDMISRLGLERDQITTSGEVRLIAANSQCIKCVGSIELSFKVDGRVTSDRVYFCKGQKGFLLSWYACKELRILPATYPSPMALQAVMSEPSACDTKEVEKVVGPIPKEPTANQRKVIRDKLIGAFTDVFSDSELKPMRCPPLRIALREGAVPYAVRTPRQIPFAWRDKVKTELDKMVNMKVVETVDDDTPAEWCHPLVCVSKPNNDVRVCVDMTKLNPYVIRPLHPFPAPRDAVSSIPFGCKYFSVFDATKGYWQMELEKESQQYTTFITPWGRYRFVRAPMGLVSTGDEFCHQGDKALVDIGNIKKVVDDSIEYDHDFPSHMKRVWKTLVRCREKGITLNKDKFVFAEPEVKFCGFYVSSQGAKADPKKLKAVREFPAPTSLTELRSFFGMVNQLSCFTPKLAATAEPLRPLLSSRNVFLWTKDHENAFEAVKSIMLAPPILAPFDKDRPTRLHTDASRSNGLGYVIRQLYDKQWRIVECGSRFLTSPETRYATVELEMLGVLWAVNKCRIYLQGLEKFEVFVDHKPLIPILNDKTMADIDNPRLLRMKEKLSPYVFKTFWVKGKDNAIPDALSRAPVDQPGPEDHALEKEINAMASEHVSAHVRSVFEDASSDPLLADLRQAAEHDPEYQLLKKTVEGGFPRPTRGAFLVTMEKNKDELSVFDGLVLLGQRVVVPKTARKSVLQKLHASHQGIVKTKRRARQCLYWPGINSDIENLVKACERCQENLPSQAHETMKIEEPPNWVFQEVATDLFSHAGYHFLVYVDRLSGWPVVVKFGKNDPDSKEVVRTIRELFGNLGVPVKLRSDNGPQFASREFQSFMNKWSVNHVTSSPRYPQSNGLAEAAVKAMKAIVVKTTVDGNLNNDAYVQAILEYRNTPRQNQVSPAELVFGHTLRSHVPAHHSLFAPQWKEKLAKAEEESAKVKVKSEEQYNHTAKPLRPLKMKDAVVVQDAASKKWLLTGSVVGRKSNRSYLVKLESGRILWRNRKFLRKINDQEPLREGEGEKQGQVENQDKDDEDKERKKVRFQDDELQQTARRSQRKPKKPERFQAS